MGREGGCVATDLIFAGPQGWCRFTSHLQTPTKSGAGKVADAPLAKSQAESKASWLLPFMGVDGCINEWLGLTLLIQLIPLVPEN